MVCNGCAGPGVAAAWVSQGWRIDRCRHGRTVCQRARAYPGEAAGIDGLSPHDCRHFWATYWAERIERLPKGLFTLQEAGGWSSLVMPRRYVKAAAVANEGMA